MLRGAFPTTSYLRLSTYRSTKYKYLTSFRSAPLAFLPGTFFTSGQVWRAGRKLHATWGQHHPSPQGSSYGSESSESSHKKSCIDCHLLPMLTTRYEVQRFIFSINWLPEPSTRAAWVSAYGTSKRKSTTTQEMPCQPPKDFLQQSVFSQGCLPSSTCLINNST